MQAVNLYAFGVTVYGYNDNMKKRHVKKKATYRYRMIDLFSLFYRFCCFELRLSINVI